MRWPSVRHSDVTRGADCTGGLLDDMVGTDLVTSLDIAQATLCAARPRIKIINAGLYIGPCTRIYHNIGIASRDAKSRGSPQKKKND